jgi:hypothetical protein
MRTTFHVLHLYLKTGKMHVIYKGTSKFVEVEMHLTSAPN